MLDRHHMRARVMVDCVQGIVCSLTWAQVGAFLFETAAPVFGVPANLYRAAQAWPQPRLTGFVRFSLQL